MKKNKATDKKLSFSHILIILILIYDLVTYLCTKVYWRPIMFLSNITNEHIALFISVFGIPLILFYDHMSKVIEQKGKREVYNMSLFEDDEEEQEDKL